MPIPLGILAVAGAGGSFPLVDDYELIQTVITNSQPNTVTISSIPQTYKALQVRFVARAQSNDTGQLDLSIQMNSLTSNASYHALYATDSFVDTTSGSGGSYMDIRTTVPLGNVSTNFGTGIIDFLDYASTTKNKTARALYGAISDFRRAGLASMAVHNTAAISSLTFRIQSPYGFGNGTRFSLYGLK